MGSCKVHSIYIYNVTFIYYYYLMSSDSSVKGYYTSTIAVSVPSYLSSYSYIIKLIMPTFRLAYSGLYQAREC